MYFLLNKLIPKKSKEDQKNAQIFKILPTANVIRLIKKDVYKHTNKHESNHWGVKNSFEIMFNIANG